MTTSLLPCPFCGRSPVILHHDRHAGGDVRRCIIVRCNSVACFVSSVVVVEGESGYRHGDVRTNAEAEQLAIEQWNTRTPQ